MVLHPTIPEHIIHLFTVHYLKRFNPEILTFKVFHFTVSKFNFARNDGKTNKEAADIYTSLYGVDNNC